MCTKFAGFFLLLFLLKERLCLKNVVLDIEPKVVEFGKDTTLRCSYDLEDAPLYTVKWYRGHREFYRFTPKEHPSTKVLHLEGMNVDRNRSNEQQVILRDVGFNLSGNFSCEVTTEAPKLYVKTAFNEMLVVVLPKQLPSLTTEKDFYDIGDVLRVNCTSTPSRPAAALSFVLNNMVVCEKCVTKKHPEGELWWSENTLELPLFRSHFKNGKLNLKCVASIGDLYQLDQDVTFTYDRNPVPARVTQSCGRSYRHMEDSLKVLFFFLFFFFFSSVLVYT